MAAGLEKREDREYPPMAAGLVDYAELRQQVADMALDRSLGQPEPAGDPALVSPSAINASTSCSRSVRTASTPESRLAATSWDTTSGFSDYESGHQEPDQP